MKKKGQVTIFIIIGLILITAIALFFVLSKQTTPKTTEKPEENPETFLESCIEDKVKNAVEVISLRGGYPNNNLSINFKFENESYINISYLCYNQNNYLPCINQKPMFMQDLKQEIKNYIARDVESCFNEITKNFNKKGHEVNVNYNDFEVELLPKRIIVQTNSEISLAKSGETTKQENFKISFSSRLYEIASVVQELVNQEARFCYSENLGIMLIYPEFNIDKFRTGGSTTIYTIENKNSKEKFRFAVRGCAIPPGI